MVENLQLRNGITPKACLPIGRGDIKNNSGKCSEFYIQQENDTLITFIILMTSLRDFD